MDVFAPAGLTPALSPALPDEGPQLWEEPASCSLPNVLVCLSSSCSSEAMEDCCKCSLLCHFCCLLVLTQLLTRVSTQEFQVLGPRDPIVAAPGGEAILPCSLSPAMSVEDMELRWFRTSFSEAVFVDWNQQEQKEEQMAEYSGRTSLVKDQFSQGKAAVRINPVRVSDSGIYVCFFKQGSFSGEAFLELKVAAMGSVPDVYIKGPEDHGVDVGCKTSGWYPKPQVQWRDSRGQTLPVSSETHTEDEAGLFSMETSLVVRDSSLGHVTCSVFNPILGEEKAKAMFIPDRHLANRHHPRIKLLQLLGVLDLLKADGQSS